MTMSMAREKKSGTFPTSTAILNALADPIIVVDQTDDIVYLNQSAEDFLQTTLSKNRIDYFQF